VASPAVLHEQRAPKLLRELNVWHATSVVAGTIIGSGIFLVPAEMMQAVGSAGLVYLAWILGGLLSFFGALTYAELAAVRPWAGGEYVYVRDAYGPLPGFLYGWTWFLITKPASIGGITAGLVRVLGNFSALSFLPHSLFSWHATPARVLVINYGHLVAIAATVLISALNYVGVRKAGHFQIAFTALKGCDDCCDRVCGIRGGFRILEQLQHHLYRGARRCCGIHGRPGRRPLGLRWLE